MLAAVLSAVGVPPEQTALIVGFVLPFDRLLDMTRTVTSASANLVVATTVARWEGAQIGRESCRERVCRDVEIMVVAGPLKNKKKKENQECSIRETYNRKQ